MSVEGQDETASEPTTDATGDIKVESPIGGEPSQEEAKISDIPVGDGVVDHVDDDVIVNEIESGDADAKSTTGSEKGSAGEGSEKGSAGEGSEKGEVDAQLEEDVEALKEELAKIVVEQPKTEIEPAEIFDESEFPSSYKENSRKEKLVLGYAENFRRQYVHLYRDRKPLFLNPTNECGVEKFVCTTIRVTKLPFPGVYDWDGAAEFVADYLNFIPLDPATELPTRLYAPTTILKRQKGNCFDYSTLLCSLLLGVGYDAYVVNGYATREMCLMDETRKICPLLKKKEEMTVEEEEKEQKKYAVRPPKDLRSKFEIKMDQREVDREKNEKLRQKQEEEQRQAELEKPPPDPLHGMRVHSWVMILSGKREVPEGFYIEPFTGIAYPLDSCNYLGIESVWNHQNYWVNMQDCSEGVKNLKYDLGDCAIWEFMFPCTDKPILQIPDAMEDEYDLDDDEEEEEEVEKHLDMPPSWILPIEISLRDYEIRCPQGKKTKLYKKAKLEKFAPYLVRDGIVCRLSIYDDRELSDCFMVKEYYKNRADKLEQRTYNHRTGWITEYYAPGRHRNLKEHTYKANSPGPENDRTMIFYNEARVDGLVKREETPVSMTEHFVDRADFLYYRTVEFGKRAKKFGPAEVITSRPIYKIVEKFNRNRKKNASEDVEERVFHISEEKIQLTYHTEDPRVSSSIREFIKPHNADENKGGTLIMSSDMHVTFQVDPTSKQKKNVELYQMMVALLEAEEGSMTTVRQSGEEVCEILNERTKEEAISELEISVYDTKRNEKAKKHRVELEKQLAEEKKRKEQMEVDYLSPFLAQIGDPEKILRAQAFRLKEDCLADLKQRLIDKANLIQARFEKETQDLQKRQQWYQQHQVSMQKDDEDEYLNYCSEAMFRIHILELRLNRHKEMAPHKYMQLEQKLRNDQRLAEYF